MFSEQTRWDYMWKYLMYSPSQIGTVYIIVPLYVLVYIDQPGIAGAAHVCKLKGKTSPIIPAVYTNFIAVAPCCRVSGLASFTD